MNWRDRIAHDATRCAAATTFEQIESILAELVEDVFLDNARIARERGLLALADVLSRDPL